MENELTSIGKILSDNLTDKKFGYICKVSMFFSFWKDIVGRKFEKKSKPYGIKSNKLFVSCENSFIVQELNMFKKDIIKKLSPYAKGLDIKINDISFNYKNWNELNNKNIEEDFEEEAYDLENLNTTEINEDEVRHIKENIDTIPYLNDAQKKKYFEDITNNLKASALRKSEN